MLTEEQQHQLQHDYEWYARNHFRIVKTDGSVAPLAPRPGQLKLYKAIRLQQDAGLPIRIRILKARQIGFSTACQGMICQRTTTRANHKAMTIAHDKTTASSLFTIAKFGYEHLPMIPWLKPQLANWSDSVDRKFLHFGVPVRQRRLGGDMGLNSSLDVDTANEYESGRGLTIQTLHASETAFWKDPRKIRSVFNAVPDEPDSMILDESTANGHNHFKEQWDAAIPFEEWTLEASHESSFIGLFVAWWEEPMYAIPFLNEDDRQDFIDNKLGRGQYGEDEEYLRDEFMCTPEQLLWRRKTIADRCENNVEIFHQEFPTTPEEAFIASGRTVYSKAMLRRLMATAKRLDPGPPAEPTAVEGIFKPGSTTKRMDRTMQDRDVPTSALWVPKEATGFEQSHPYWRIFVPPREASPNAVEGRYIVACDPAGDPSPDPKKTAAHAIQVIDHFTGEQVAELETWIDADLIADELLLVALYYNNAVIAVETTGGYGMSMVKKLAFDYWYPHMYAGKRLDGVKDDYERRLGWNTSRTSKKVLEDTMREALRTDTHGIKSQRLAKQFFNYVDLGNGQTGAEKGKRVDGVMAYQIAKQIKLEEAPRPQMSDAVVVTSGRRGDPRTGW